MKLICEIYLQDTVKPPAEAHKLKTPTPPPSKPPSPKPPTPPKKSRSVPNVTNTEADTHRKTRPCVTKKQRKAGERKRSKVNSPKMEEEKVENKSPEPPPPPAEPVEEKR